MIFKNLLFTALILSTTSLYAENHMLIIGGGGEPVRDYTIFDTGMEQLGKNVEKSNWKYEVSYNGGHSTTERILQREFPSPSAPITDFTAEKYHQLLEDYKNKILSGKIKSGDQMIVLINSHGASKNKNTKTHLISAKGGAATDLNNLQGSKLVSLDLLEEIVKLTNERGIKLGIVDLSCHSGNSMALKNNAPNTCIITATGPVHYGFAGPSAFIDKFLLNLTPGTNLEEAFLKGRIQSSDPAYPMISTEANDQIVKDVYDSITPYLYYYDAKNDKMTDYIVETANENLICQREQNFKQLMTQIDGLQSIFNSKKNGLNANVLRELLIDYKKSQDQVLKASLAMGADKFSTKETFVLAPNSKLPSFAKLEYTWKELLNLDIDKRISDYEKFKNFSTSKKSKDENQLAIDYLKIVKEKKESIIRQYPKLKDFRKNTRILVTAMSNTRVIADKIAIQERQFYDDLYRRKQNDASNNPCKKIIF
jgi:soluble cytochrome b562